MKNKKNSFKYVVLIGVLIIPFMYSFFYLKAYWNPYGKGNIDNLPVAIVNEDEGKRGQELIDQIKEKDTLKLRIVNNEKAEEGLYNKKYYAVITIPKDFTSSMESISTNNKKHPTITYSPNQKSNYLASQIIDKVITVVEKNLDNSINKEIISSLSENLESVPSKMDTISTGFEELNNGTDKLQQGANTVNNGTESLQSNYDRFNDGVKSIKEGTDKLNNATSEFSQVSNGVNELSSGVAELKAGSNQVTAGLNSYVEGVNSTLNATEAMASYIKLAVCPQATSDPTGQLTQLCGAATQLTTANPQTSKTLIETLRESGTILKEGNTKVNVGVNELNNKVSSLALINDKLIELQTGIKTLNEGAITLYDSSLQIQSGINKLSTGTKTLNTGATTLNNSVRSAKNELNSNIDTTREDVKKVNDLTEYSKEPVKVKTKAVNKVSSYGTAFSPFFISIALWVGCLMMYIVLYYDKDNRFEKLSIETNKRLRRTGYYHGLATLTGITLGVLLQLFLDFEITNIFLYYFSTVLVANTFLAIIEFLIVNLKDIGKFIALILLVLQLAAAGGTFPIETVTKGFRWLHGILPMTYTINLLRESLVQIESNLLTKNIIIVTTIMIVLVIINVINDVRYEKKNK